MGLNLVNKAPVLQWHWSTICVTSNPTGPVQLICTWGWWVCQEIYHLGSVHMPSPQDWTPLFPEVSYISSNQHNQYHWASITYELYGIKYRKLTALPAYMCRLNACCFSWVNSALLEAWIILSIAEQHDSSDLYHFVLKLRSLSNQIGHICRHFEMQKIHLDNKIKGERSLWEDIYFVLLLCP